jgi:hypothetical protein
MLMNCLRPLEPSEVEVLLLQPIKRRTGISKPGKKCLDLIGD